MQYDAKAVANAFLELANKDGTPVDHLKLQKLVYLAHGWRLALHDERLIQNEIQAWEYGPVIPTLYHEFKHLGVNPITGRAVEYDPERGVYAPSLQDYEDRRAVDELIHEVWGVYGWYTSIQLSNMTHADGTPWQRTVAPYSGKIPHGVVIPDELIREHFAAEARKQPQ